MSTCHGCGGVVGRDCFNPQECEEITRQQVVEYQRMSSQQIPPSVDNPEIHVTNEMVDAVEDIVGMGRGAWDMVNPKAIIAAVLSMAQQTVPQWHDRPTGPGKWICTPDKEHESSVPCPTVLDLTAGDLARGAPFHTGRVYGPIPNDKVA